MSDTPGAPETTFELLAPYLWLLFFLIIIAILYLKH